MIRTGLLLLGIVLYLSSTAMAVGPCGAATPTCPSAHRLCKAHDSNFCFCIPESNTCTHAAAEDFHAIVPAPELRTWALPLMLIAIVGSVIVHERRRPGLNENT